MGNPDDMTIRHLDEATRMEKKHAEETEKLVKKHEEERYRGLYGENVDKRVEETLVMRFNQKQERHRMAKRQEDEYKQWHKVQSVIREGRKNSDSIQREIKQNAEKEKRDHQEMAKQVTEEHKAKKKKRFWQR